MTYERFLSTDFENPKVEWINRRVLEISPSHDRHQQVGTFLITLLETFVDERKLGVVRYESFQMKTGPDLPGRSPDILFVSNAHKERLKKTFVDGPADLVVEIISPDSRTRDRREKFDEYEKGGVREYWLIDPDKKRAEFFILDKRGLYQAAGQDANGMLRSVVLKGVWIKPGWLWQSPMPTVISIFREWGLI
jgi:Uma2 family endonuclease